MQPCRRFGIFRTEPEQFASGGRADRAQERSDNTEVIKHGAESMPWAKKVICLHQRTPLIFQMINQVTNLDRGQGV